MSSSRHFLRRGIGFLLLAGALIYLTSFVFVLAVSRQDKRGSADTIVVLGAAQYNGRPSPVLRARLDHAVELYREGWAPLVIVTGGIGTGDRVSEATVSRAYLIEQQVPETAVVVRPEGRSTQASMRSVATWMHERDLNRALLVSDPFHMCRLLLEARRVGLAAASSPTTTSPISERRRTELAYLAAEALKVPVAWARSW